LPAGSRPAGNCATIISYTYPGRTLDVARRLRLYP
jgi:hypothetical protein